MEHAIRDAVHRNIDVRYCHVYFEIYIPSLQRKTAITTLQNVYYMQELPVGKLIQHTFVKNIFKE